MNTKKVLLIILTCVIIIMSLFIIDSCKFLNSTKKNYETILSSCDSEKSIDKIENIKDIMIEFFINSLTSNYGTNISKHEALQILIKGLDTYQFHYIININKEEIAKINSLLYPDLLYSYFFEIQSLEWHPAKNSPEYNRYDPFGVIGALPLRKYTNEPTYLTNELMQSTHPFLNSIVKENYDLVGVVDALLVWRQLLANQHNCISDFAKDKDVKFFLTLYFWRYLCYCANIDFESGKDKTEQMTLN